MSNQGSGELGCRRTKPDKSRVGNNSDHHYANMLNLFSERQVTGITKIFMKISMKIVSTDVTTGCHIQDN
jgi:hypothetical protein